MNYKVNDGSFVYVYTCEKRKKTIAISNCTFFRCDKDWDFRWTFTALTRKDSSRSRSLRQMTAKHASRMLAYARYGPHESACVRAFDFAEAQTETKDYTTWLTRRSEQQTWTMRVRVHVPRARGRGEWRNWQRKRERKRKRAREREKKRDRTTTERWDIHHALTNSASIARACERVYGQTWMCAEKRILPSSVERTRASSCQRTPPRKPLWNQPHPSWRTPAFPLRVAGSFPWLVVPPSLFGQSPHGCDSIEELCALHESESNTSSYRREWKLPKNITINQIQCFASFVSSLF